MTSKEKVLSVYPEAQCIWTSRGWRVMGEVPGIGMEEIGRTRSAHVPEDEAWDDAASKLPSAPSPAGETASETDECEGGECWHNPETGYLEACPKHDAIGMDRYMDAEAARRAVPEPVSTEGEHRRVWIDPRTQEPCRRCDGTGKMPPWPGSKGSVACGVCRETETVAAPIAPAAVSDAEMLPCPFCGGAAQPGESDDGGHFIECSKCRASTNLTYFLKEDASSQVLHRWNRRMSSQTASAPQYMCKYCRLLIRPTSSDCWIDTGLHTCCTSGPNDSHPHQPFEPSAEGDRVSVYQDAHITDERSRMGRLGLRPAKPSAEGGRIPSDAIRSAAKFAKEFARTCRHTEAVSECAHCNLSFLATWAENLLPAPPSGQGEKR